jgi:N-terminal domain of anti-restriction factor ArdC
VWSIAILPIELSEELRLSWGQLPVEAVSNPGFLHEAYSRFWNYSLTNQLLALIQCQVRGIEPGPLASFNKWKELGRRVKNGEKALTLCMPIQIKCREWDEKRQESGLIEDFPKHVGYRTVFVYKRNWFVLSQTEGTPFMPEPLPAWNKEAALATVGIREEPFASTDGNCQGYATQARTIAISPIAVLPWKTLFHEVAHIVLGHIGAGGLSDGETPERSLREVEALSRLLSSAAKRLAWKAPSSAAVTFKAGWPARSSPRNPLSASWGRQR